MTNGAKLNTTPVGVFICCAMEAENALRFGVGARITLAVMSDRYVDIILTALKEVDATGLVVETSDVSTYIGGSEADILRYLTDLSSAIGRSGHHAAIAIHLFRGCPGSTCEKTPRISHPPKGRHTSQYAAAEWALYPLVDDTTGDHMRDIYAAIDLAVANGTFRKSEKSVTRLEGDLGLVLETAIAGWTMVGKSVQHVASHLTVSLNSPSHTQ